MLAVPSRVDGNLRVGVVWRDNIDRTNVIRLRDVSPVVRRAILWIRQFGIKFRTYPVRFAEESFDYQIADFRPFHCMSGARVYDARFIRDRSHGWI